MAKTPVTQENPFRKTTGEQEQPQPEPGNNADLDEGRIMSAGVGITAGELAALDALAEKHEVSRNALMRLAVRMFIERARAGAINLDDYFVEPEKPKKRSRIGKQTRH